MTLKRIATGEWHDALKHDWCRVRQEHRDTCNGGAVHKLSEEDAGGPRDEAGKWQHDPAEGFIARESGLSRLKIAQHAQQLCREVEIPCEMK